MVTFRLAEETKEHLVYLYYPEGRDSKRPGIIILDRATERLEIKELAEEDWSREISSDELNEFGKKINDLAQELGTNEYVKMVDKSKVICFYGDHAKKAILEKLREGTIPTEGVRYWY